MARKRACYTRGGAPLYSGMSLSRNATRNRLKMCVRARQRVWFDYETTLLRALACVEKAGKWEKWRLRRLAHRSSRRERWIIFMLHHHTRLPSATTIAYAPFSFSSSCRHINLCEFNLNQLLLQSTIYCNHRFRLVPTSPRSCTMHATKIFQAGRQPLIRFLGKRTTPSRM